MGANNESSYELTEENLRKLARRNQRPLKCKFCYRNFKYRQVIIHHLQEEHSDLIRKILKFKIDQVKKVMVGPKSEKSETFQNSDGNLNQRTFEKILSKKACLDIPSRRTSVIKENPNHSSV